MSVRVTQKHSYDAYTVYKWSFNWERKKRYEKKENKHTKRANCSPIVWKKFLSFVEMMKNKRNMCLKNPPNVNNKHGE